MINEKIKLNMVGGGFQHDVCSVALNTNKYVDWDKSRHESKISFHIDSGICNIPVNPNKINFGWVTESSAIIPSVVKNISENIQFYKERFRCIFTYDLKLINKDPDYFKIVQPPANSWIQNKQIYKKSKLISFIGSNKIMCSGHSYRQEMINKFKHSVDHFGRGFPGKELPFTMKIDSEIESGKILGLRDYMYSIVMENAVYDDYYCEKITDCFATGTIPIYWGSKSIGKYFDANGIIFLEDLEDLEELDENLYNRKMKHIENNLQTLKKMNTPEDFIYLNYLREMLLEQ